MGTLSCEEGTRKWGVLQMSYTTDSDVRYYLSALGSNAGGIGTDVLGTYAVSLHLSWADSIIDLKLAKRYEVPFSTTPPAIASISTTLTAWKSLRSIFSNEIPSALAFVEDDYKKAMELLDQVQSGSADLPTGTSGGLIGERGQATKFWSSNMDYFPTFDVDDELNQAVDSDRISDIGDSRE